MILFVHLKAGVLVQLFIHKALAQTADGQNTHDFSSVIVAFLKRRHHFSTMSR
jgi:hypothetical protein